MVRTTVTWGSEARSCGAWRGSATRAVGMGAGGSGVEQAGVDAHCQDAIAHRQGGGGVAVRAQAFGATGNGDQEGGLLGFQGVGRHAEPGEGAGTDTLEIAAERRQRQPDIQHATATETELELEGAGHLDQLRAQRARAGLEQAGGLHGDGRPAGDDVACADELGGGAKQGERINAGMEPEAPILDGDQ